jgi:cell division protein FtsB
MRLLRFKYIYTWLFSLFFGCFFSVIHVSAQVEKLFHLSPDGRVFQLWKAAYAENREHNQLMSFLDSVKTISKSRHDYRLYWYADFHQFYRKAIRFGKPESWYAEAEAYADHCPESVVKASCWFSFGNALFKNQRFEQAYKLLFRARNEFERIEYEHIPEASVYLFQSMEQYYYFEDYPTAIQYGLLAEQLNQVTSNQIIQGLNTLGMAYQRQKEYGKAKETFMKVMSLSEEHVNADYLGIATGNYGNTLRLEGHTKEALPFLYTDYEINSQSLPENTAMTCLHIAEALMALDSIPKAKIYLDRARQLNPKKVGDTYSGTYFEVQTLYYRKAKNLPLAAAYLDSALTLKDSLRTAFNLKIQTAYQSEISAKKYLNTIQNSEVEQVNTAWLQGVMISSLLLISLVGWYAFDQRRKKTLLKKEIAQNRKNHALSQLECYVTGLRERNELLEKSIKELKESNFYSDSSLMPQPDISAPLYALLKNMMLTEKDWQLFNQLFEEAYPEFFGQLTVNAADLTSFHRRLLMLTKLTVSSKEIAFMMGMTVESIRKSRQRLRKKLEPLQANTDFEEVIEVL